MSIKGFEEIRKIAERNEFVSLILPDPKEYVGTTAKVIKHLVNGKKLPGVYVSITKPYSVIKKAFEKESVNGKMLIFIDTSGAGSNAEKTGNCVHIPSPKHLTDLSIAIVQAVEAIPSKNKFLFLDSVSALTTHNSPENTVKFARFLINKMQAWELKGIILSLEQDEKLLRQLSIIVDEVIDLTEGGKKWI